MVVDFWADWCAPCKMIELIMEELAEEYGDKVFFGKLDVDGEQEVAMEYQVLSILAVLFFKNGELADRSIGAVPKEQLEENLKDLLD